MNKVLLLSFFVALSFTATAQENSDALTNKKKADSARKAFAAKEQRYWDSVNAKGLHESQAEVLKKFGAKKGAKINKGIVEIGDTKEMCGYAWGSADTQRADGNKESWYYRNKKTALTFSNGKLIKITEL